MTTPYDPMRDFQAAVLAAAPELTGVTVGAALGTEQPPFATVRRQGGSRAGSAGAVLAAAGGRERLRMTAKGPAMRLRLLRKFIATFVSGTGPALVV